MAIQKTKTLANGITGNYWKVTSISLSKQAMTITAVISLFTDAAHTTTSPINPGKTYKIPNCTKIQLAGDMLALCYTSIKAQAAVLVNGQPTDPDIAGGTDV